LNFNAVIRLMPEHLQAIAPGKKPHVLPAAQPATRPFIPQDQLSLPWEMGCTQTFQDNLIQII
jgi:hypothetical protein